MLQQRSHSSSQVHKIIFFWYYNKSINGGDTRHFIANVKIFFVYWNKFLDTIQITFKNLGSFQGECLWRSSVLVKPLSLPLLMILILMVLRNFMKILWTLTIFFCFIVTIFSLNLLCYIKTDFSSSNISNILILFL